MEITDLSERRRAAEQAATPEYAVCPCGEAWFELRAGAVCMTPGGSVTGWTGAPHCVSCGTRYAPPPNSRS